MGLGKTLQTIAFLAAVLKSPAAGAYTRPLLSST
jgi:SNF2 family DNA or RNA helicase